METNAYKEFSYKIRGFKTLSIIIACVTIVLCLLVGIGCWVLVAGVRENETLLNKGDTISEKIEVEIVEGHADEPLRLPRKMESLNKVGRVVQHIAEIDFDDGSSTASKDYSQQPSVRLSEAEPTLVIEEIEIIPEKKEARHNDRELEAIREKIGEPMEIDGVVGVRLQPPSVDGVSAASPNNGQYLKNDLTVVEEPAAVYSASFKEHVRPDAHPALHQSILDTLVNFTSELSEDIANQGLFDTLLDRTSEKYMRDTFQWIGDYTSQLVNGEQLAPRSKRSAGIPLTLIGQALAYTNYAFFGKFLFSEVNAIAEYNMEARKLSGDPIVELLDSTFWSGPQTASPKKDTESSTPLTAANDDWEPQVNKVSLAFVGEILNTLLNMMREYLMKDHVMECLWFMFCEDLNHQAKYADVYGLLARVNSVGLKVLTDKEERQMDTMSEVWRSLTAWESLQCEEMFPKCDGPKALEIVNEVAIGARK